MDQVQRTSSESRGERGPGGAGRPGWARSVGLFLILSGFWLLLSGRIGLQYFAMMALAVGLVMYLNPARPFGPDAHGRTIGLTDHFRGFYYTLRYVVWLLYNIVKANLEVAYLVLHPRMPIDPGFLQFRIRMPSEVAQVLIANSITLTPGTVTIDIEDGEYIVHALVPRSAKGVVDGDFQRMVAPIFRNEVEGAPEHLWRHSVHTIEPPGWKGEEGR